MAKNNAAASEKMKEKRSTVPILPKWLDVSCYHAQRAQYWDNEFSLYIYSFLPIFPTTEQVHKLPLPYTSNQQVWHDLSPWMPTGVSQSAHITTFIHTPIISTERHVLPLPKPSPISKTF
jgi:hypothetical protein